MGCGKSTLAKLISQHLPLKFVDSDSEVEKRFNLSVSNIFSKFGEETFRKMEANVLNNIVAIPVLIVIVFVFSYMLSIPSEKLVRSITSNDKLMNKIYGFLGISDKQ